MQLDMECVMLGKTVHTMFKNKVIKSEKFATKSEATLEYWTNVKCFRAVEKGPLTKTIRKYHV